MFKEIASIAANETSIADIGKSVLSAESFTIADADRLLEAEIANYKKEASIVEGKQTAEPIEKPQPSETNVIESNDVDQNNSSSDPAKELRGIKEDDNGLMYMKDGQLLPSINYSLNGNSYITDKYSRIIECRGKIKYTPEAKRDLNAQKTVGGIDRLPTDDGSHLIGRDIGGDSGIGNMVPMDLGINRSDYKRMENYAKELLNKGHDVEMNIDLSYKETSKRPDIITVKISPTDTLFRFDNNKNNSLMREIGDVGKKEVTETLNDCNGWITSLKQTFLETGETDHTQVSIMYKDDITGNTYRKKVEYDG